MNPNDPLLISESSRKYGLIRARDGQLLASGRSRASLQPMASFLTENGVECFVRLRVGSGSWMREGETFASFRKRTTDYLRERRNKNMAA